MDENFKKQFYNPNYNPKVKFIAKTNEYLYKNAKKNTTLCVIFCIKVVFWWAEVDSNHRSRRRQIYSLIHLAALESAQNLSVATSLLCCGAGDWTRTHNLLITNQLLCQLSYTGVCGVYGIPKGIKQLIPPRRGRNLATSCKSVARKSKNGYFLAFVCLLARVNHRVYGVQALP